MFNTSTGCYSLADIAAATGGGNRNGNGWGDDGSWWIILLFLFAFGGWGNGGWGSNGGGTTREEISYGFDINGLENGIRGVQQGLCDGFYAQNSTMLQGFNGLNNTITTGTNSIQNTLCQGFNGINMGISAATNALQSDINGVNIAAMQNSNALATQLADCCCENRASIAQVRYDMATDTCAINTNLSNNTRDIIESQNNNTRAILDAITENRVETLKEKISALTLQNQGLQFAASQQAQNAYLLGELKPCPIPAYVVDSPYCCTSQPSPAYVRFGGCGGCGTIV
jgi:hypothetical protein